MRQFKVLSIDGGGIKGLYSARILSLFEAELRRQHGDAARIVDYADLICGTSTGGLIALGLALRIPTETICEFYETKGPAIFNGSQGRLARLRQDPLVEGQIFGQATADALQELLQGRTMADSECLLCIRTYDFTQGTYEIFKYDHREGNLSRDNKLPMVDVALATCRCSDVLPVGPDRKGQ